MSCAYRAFYAIKGLRSSAGESTNAVYGFTTLLLKIMREQKPYGLAVIFDSKAPTFRHDRFKDYKAQRKPMPEDLVEQLPLIKEVIGAYNIEVVEKEGFEADDLMGSIALKAARLGYEVYLVTNDKDMFQVVGKNIFIWRPGGRAICDEASVRKRFGVEPGRLVEIFALAGDATDNVPGVPGIGEKTAIELVKEYGNLEGVLSNIKSIRGEKRRESIVCFAEQARLSRDLVTVKTDIPLKYGPEDFRLSEPDTNRVSELFRRLEFSKLQASVLGGEEHKKKSYGCINDPEALARLIGQLKKQQAFSITLVTTSREAMYAELVGVALSWHEGTAYYMPLNGAVDREEVLKRLHPVLEDGGIRKIVHGGKYDLLVLRNCGITMRGVVFDTMLAAYVLNPSAARYGLEDCALKYFNRKVTPITRLLGDRRDRITVGDIPAETVASYAGECADVTLNLKKLMEPKLKEQRLLALLREVEMPLMGVLADMERTGVRVDTEILRGLSREFGKLLDGLAGSIYAMAGGPFNINSSKQLRRVLFETLKLPATEKTKTGYSTNFEVLVGLSKMHPLPSKLLEYRQLNKLKSTYIDALPRMVNPRTGRIHTTFIQTGTATGRLASSEPNLQNIPVRSEVGRRIREAFIPRDGRMIFLSADYSQIDLRVLAHLSGDRELLDAFEKGEDIHRRTAAAVFGVAASDVTPEMRRQAKTINFGIIYGMSDYGLSRDLGIDQGDARKFIDLYFTRYGGVRDYIQRNLRDAENKGFVTTLLNRRRYVPELGSSSHATVQFGRRVATNTPIQGSSADLIKVAMLAVHEEIRTKRWHAAMLIQIHDELLFEVDRVRAEEFGRMVKEKMEGVWKLRVPLRVHLKTGENWGEL
jgi:DNA polymerase-1